MTAKTCRTCQRELLPEESSRCPACSDRAMEKGVTVAGIVTTVVAAVVGLVVKLGRR